MDHGLCYRMDYIDKMQRRFLKMCLSKHIFFYKFFHLTHINQHLSVNAGSNFQDFTIALQVMKLKVLSQVWEIF